MANVKDLLVNGSARVIGTIYGNATSANKVNHSLTFGSKSFNGSSAQTITLADLGGKPTQSAVSSPSASGTAISFIDTISQNANGVITATKKTVRDASASQSGVVSTGTQTFAGNKTFTGASYFSDSISIKAGKEIKTVGTNATLSMIRFLDNTTNSYGNGISIGGGGVTVLGSGESASSLNVNAGEETLYLLSDGAVNIEANADTIANRIGFQVTQSGNLIPVKAESGTDNTQNIGASGNRWANIYATKFHGALDGNASSATKANYLTLYESRGVTTNLNKTANYVAAGAMFHLVASSSTTTGKCPTDANILQMNWDNAGGYDAQIGVSTATPARMYFRSRASEAGAWQEVAHAPVGHSVGSTTTPVYMDAEGIIKPATGTLTNSISGNAATATNADKLDGLHASDFTKIYKYTIPAGVGVRIKYPSYGPCLVTACGDNNGAQLILLGTGYGAHGTVRNKWTELVSCSESNFTWSLPEVDGISCSVEVMNHRSSDSSITVWANDTIVFTAITALTSPKQNHVLLNSSNYTNYTVKKDGTGASGTWRINITGNAATATKATQDSDGNVINSTYLKKRSLVETSQTSVTSGSSAGTSSALILYGQTYGNDAAYLKTSGKMSYGDPGPQIQFSSALSGGQRGALIFTDHDTIGAGVSLSLVSTESDTWFIAPHIKALTGFVGNLSGNASTATTATNLAAAGTWTWSNGTTSGPTASLVLGGKTTSIGAIPAASSSISGIITTGAQSLAGEKTFTSNLTIKRNTPNLYITDTSTAVNTYSIIRMGSTNASGTTNPNAAYIFLNGPQRTDDGGNNLLTIRNNVGNLRLNNSTINTGRLTIGQESLNTSYTQYVNGTSYFSDNISIKAGKEIRTVGTKATLSMIRFLDNTSNAYGNGISIGGGGVTILGAGESASSLSVAADTETLYLLSDGTVNIEANADTIANRIGFQVNTSGHLLPIKAEAGNNSAQDIGSYDYRIRDIYANTLRLRTAASNPSQTAGARLEFSYYNSSTDLGQPVFLHYCPNDSYRAPAGLKIFGGSGASPAWLEVEGNVYAPTFNGTLNGNAATATKLATARTINGTSFDGSANITTANWGTARTLTIGKTGKSVNGSANVSWTLAEIGAAAASHSHTTLANYYSARNASANVTHLSDGSMLQFKATSTMTTAKPPCGDAHILHFNWDNSGAYDAQLALKNSGNGDAYVRGNNNGSWSSWHKLWMQGDSVTGAVWNDYAEYREADTIQGGRCVREVGDDTLALTTKRLMRGCSITSDTWGFAQGETDKAKTPIAVAGRVLAYPLEDRELFKEYIGYSVCSGPDGTVSLMTEEEELKYPWAIIGTVSAVPDYEEWGGGEMADRPSVKVDGRIWIKVK